MTLKAWDLTNLAQKANGCDFFADADFPSQISEQTVLPAKGPAHGNLPAQAVPDQLA